MLGYYIVKLFSKLMCVAPEWFRKMTAGLLGWIALVATPTWRLKMAQANIQECLGVDAKRAEEIAHGSLTRFGRMIVEVMRFPLLKPTNIDQLVKMEGMEHMEEAFAEGKGVVMVTGHFGNWELLGASLALHGYPILSIARKQNNGAMDKLINEFREMPGQKIAYNQGKNELLSISRMLKEKNCLGILFDQDTNDDGVATDIFGKKCVVPYGAAALSRMYGAPILPIFLHNNEDGTCTAVIHEVLHAPKTKDKQQDFYNVTRQMLIVLEQEIIEHPEMWFWVHDRWKDGRERFGGVKKKKKKKKPVQDLKE